MKRFLKEHLKLGDKLAENFFAILIISLGGAVIYGLPYFRFDYYDAYLEMYNLTNTQMGVFGSIYGIFGFISYLFGGYIADKVSIRKIITFSLVGTGLGGFIHLLPLNFPALVLLYAFWGFSSLFAFWPACVKSVRLLADKDNQGKAYGYFEGGRGVFAALSAMGAVWVYQWGTRQIGNEFGIHALITFYSVITILSGVFAWFKVNDEVVYDESEKINFSELKNVVKLKSVWIISIVTFCNYVFLLSMYYFVPYGTSFMGLTVAGGALLSASKRWVAPISNIGGGYLGDKMGTSRLLFSSFIGMMVGTILMMLLPTDTNSSLATILFIILYIINYLFLQVNSSLAWAMLEEGQVPEKYSGTASGLISTLGYLPDVFISLFAGQLLDNFSGTTGYNIFFIFLIIVLGIGAVFVRIWQRFLLKEENHA